MSSLPTGKFHELIGLSQIAVFDLRLKHGTGLDLTAIECLGAIQFASSLRVFKTLKSETQQNILDSYSDRLSELTVRLNGLAGDPCGLECGLEVKRSTVVGDHQVGIPTAASGKCFCPGNVLI